MISVLVDFLTFAIFIALFCWVESYPTNRHLKGPHQETYPTFRVCWNFWKLSRLSPKLLRFYSCLKSWSATNVVSVQMKSTLNFKQIMWNIHNFGCQAKFLTSRHVRRHTVIFYISNTLRKLMVRAYGLRLGKCVWLGYGLGLEKEK